jgi:hypothetical protein
MFWPIILTTTLHGGIQEMSQRDICCYEPFYQMMRQTLLGWQMTMRKEYSAEDWVHVHVIPNENTQLRETITSPGLSGKDITEAWREF